MKNRFWIALPLAAALAVPTLAQQTSPSTQDQTSAQTQATTTQRPDQAAADQQVNREPLKLETHEGFWGKLNPFARKKYVQRQLGPVTNRVNELDELTAKNAKDIKDVDSRAQEGIRQSMAKANEADQHAVQAGQTAQQAQQTAQQAGQRIDTVSRVVTNLDQYKPVTNAEIRFRPGQTVLSKKAKEALDQMASNLKDQRGYIVEIQGFSSGRGAAAIEQSQRMADAVRRYLVINSDVPVYRVHVLGMGNAPIKTEDGKTERVRGARVEVSLLKNSLGSMAAATPSSSMPSSSSTSNSNLPASDQTPPASSNVGASGAATSTSGSSSSTSTGSSSSTTPSSTTPPPSSDVSNPPSSTQNPPSSEQKPPAKPPVL